MIPEFDENGNLPPGVHFCEWDEFVERFGYNDPRVRLITGLQMAMEQLQPITREELRSSKNRGKSQENITENKQFQPRA